MSYVGVRLREIPCLRESGSTKGKYRNFPGRISMFMDGKCKRGSLPCAPCVGWVEPLTASLQQDSVSIPGTFPSTLAPSRQTLASEAQWKPLLKS